MGFSLMQLLLFCLATKAVLPQARGLGVHYRHKHIPMELELLGKHICDLFGEQERQDNSQLICVPSPCL